MRVIVCKNYDEVSGKAAEIVESQVTLKPDSVLGFATGSTPIGMYEKLAQSKTDFSQIRTFNLDEYYPIEKSNPQSYRYFMDKHFFDRVNIDKKNIRIPDGETKDVEAECEKYDREIKNSGGIDLQILGIGQNGHIGFNEPDANLSAGTHLTNLTQSTIAANSRFFDDEKNVPKQAITMGISTILSAKKIVLLAVGASKSRVVSEMLKGRINTEIPATMLNVHGDVTLICDEEAYKSAKLGIDIGGTEIKFAVVDNGKIVHKSVITTNQFSTDAIINDVVSEFENINGRFPVKSIGIGVPGSVIHGLVTTDNLPFEKFPLQKILQEKISLPITVDNDANCAVLGEKFTASEEYENIVMVTIGTGIGGGIIINNKLCCGNGEFGEVGHMVIQAQGGRKCACGRCGCFEQYASVTALLRCAESEAEQYPESKLYSAMKDKSKKFDGKRFFEIMESGCDVCEKVFDEYIGWLVTGLKNLENIFDPDVIIISGGITKQKDKILGAIEEKDEFKAPIIASKLAGDAGAIGAALL